jgi:IS30 family transposase
MAHKHLTQEQRYHIYSMIRIGKNKTEIAMELGKDKSTITREIKRNSGARGYRPNQANDLACLRKENAPKAIKMTVEVMLLVTHFLEEKWSPEQISGWLLINQGVSISHESIYQFVVTDKKSGGTLWMNLRWQKKRKKRYGTKSHDRRGQIKNKVSIEDRPSVVDEKTRKGDWEGDLVIGKNHKNALLTLVDRKTKLVRILKVESKRAEEVGNAIYDALEDMKVHTITFDNGKEFSNHEELAKKLNTKIYFAHPYCSNERGLNENTNGLIRQYFPKKSDFTKLTAKDVAEVESFLNNRPRKSLNYCTPHQVYYGQKKPRIT